MTTLVEFLTARLDEDEADARLHTTADDSTAATEYAYLVARRVLREVEAKRAIIDAAFVLAAGIDNEHCVHGADEIRRGTSDLWIVDGEEMEPLPADCSGTLAAEAILRPLASVYADHPSYDQAWRV